LPPWTAIVATYGRADEVASCLASLHAQSHAPAEILVADDTPDDSVARVAGGVPGVRLLRPGGRPSLTRARNAAWRAAATDWLLYIDSDATLPPRAGQEDLAALVAADARAGSQRPPPAQTSLALRSFWRLFRLPESGPRDLRPRVPPTWTPRPAPRADDLLWTLHGSNMWICRTGPDGAAEAPPFEHRMERYALWEDLDASLTLRARDPDAAFLTVPVGVHHAPSLHARLERPDLFRMNIAHMAWLAWKHAGTTRRVDRLVAWSTLGHAIQRGRNDPAHRGDWLDERLRVLDWAREHIRPVAQDAGGEIPFHDHFEFLAAPERAGA
jgi:glycosyltransferase involved in cell wall biosynthesis